MEQTINIRELNERIQKESEIIDLITMEMNKVIIGQQHLVESLLKSANRFAFKRTHFAGRCSRFGKNTGY